MDQDSSELKIMHKLTPLHVTVAGMERQKVRLTAQSFFRTTAAAIRYIFPEKHEMEIFFELVDVLNSRKKPGKFACTSSVWLGSGGSECCAEHNVNNNHQTTSCWENDNAAISKGIFVINCCS